MKLGLRVSLTKTEKQCYFLYVYIFLVTPYMKHLSKTCNLFKYLRYLFIMYLCIYTYIYIYIYQTNMKFICLWFQNNDGL